MPRDMTYFSSVLLAVISVLLAAFVIADKPWRHNKINTQHFVNELALYFLIVFSLCFTDRAIHGDTADVLGWIMIGLLVLVIFYNIILMVQELIKNARKIYAIAKMNKRKS